METTYRNMTVEHMGQGANGDDLAAFRAMCEAYQLRWPQATEREATDAIWGDGDWLRNAMGILTTMEAGRLYDLAVGIS